MHLGFPTRRGGFDKPALLAAQRCLRQVLEISVQEANMANGKHGVIPVKKKIPDSSGS